MEKQKSECEADVASHRGFLGPYLSFSQAVSDLVV